MHSPPSGKISCHIGEKKQLIMKKRQISFAFPMPAPRAPARNAETRLGLATSLIEKALSPAVNLHTFYAQSFIAPAPDTCNTSLQFTVALPGRLQQHRLGATTQATMPLSASAMRSPLG